MTGTTIAQAIPIAITPILTRIYTPEDFGVLALFISITAILRVVANGRYELAIMLPENDEDAINIAALGLLVASFFSLFLFFLTILLNRNIATLLGNQEIEYWLYLVPFVVFMAGLYNLLNYLNTRKSLYKDIAKSNVYKSVGMASVQLSIGLVKSGATGLISGQIVSQFISNYRLAINAASNYDLKKITKSEIKRLARRYIDFPKISLWAVLANSLAYNLTSILFSFYFSISTLGFYSLSQKILGMPMALMGSSIGQVYFQQANQEKQLTGSAIKTFNSTFLKLGLISFLTFTPLFFILPISFKIIFGAEWIIAGEFAQIILPFIAVKFIAVALSNTTNIFEKQIIALVWQVTLMVLSLSILIYSHYAGLDFTTFLKLFSVTNTFLYGVLCIILWKISRGSS